MKCEYVARLLPLYAGRDLDEKRSCLVAAHLQSCTQCIRAADEYARANQLLQQLDAPFFSDEIYAGIRRRVLNEIERQSHTSSWSRSVSQLLTPLVQSPVSWVTAALLLTTSVVALYFNLNRSTRLPYNQPVADGVRTQADNRANFQTEKNKHSSATSSSGSLTPARTRSTGKKVVNAGHRSTKRREPGVEVAQRGMLTPGTLRVEMQTRDRNIRIIWLGSQPAQAGVKETAKGL